MPKAETSDQLNGIHRVQKRFVIFLFAAFRPPEIPMKRRRKDVCNFFNRRKLLTTNNLLNVPVAVVVYYFPLLWWSFFRMLSLAGNFLFLNPTPTRAFRHSRRFLKLTSRIFVFHLAQIGRHRCCGIEQIITSSFICHSNVAVTVTR